MTIITDPSSLDPRPGKKPARRRRSRHHRIREVDAMNIFIAGSSQRRAEIHELYQQIYAKGHTGYDWTRDRGFDDPSRFNPQLSADNDLEAVRDCDAVIWYVDEAPSHGAPFEAGYAYGLDIPVIVFASNISLLKFRNLIYAYTQFGYASRFEMALDLAEKAVGLREAANV